MFEYHTVLHMWHTRVGPCSQTSESAFACMPAATRSLSSWAREFQVLRLAAISANPHWASELHVFERQQSVFLAPSLVPEARLLARARFYQRSCMVVVLVGLI